MLSCTGEKSFNKMKRGHRVGVLITAVGITPISKQVKEGIKCQGNGI